MLWSSVRAGAALAVEDEYAGPFVEVRERVHEVFHAAGVNPLGRQGQVAGDRTPGVRATGRLQGLQHGPVAIGRFDEDLGGIIPLRALFKFTQGVASGLGFAREIAVKGKALADQA